MEPSRTNLDDGIDLFSLPEEVQELILNRLRVEDLLSCAQVSKSWNTGINRNRIWKKWCQSKMYSSELLDQCFSHLFVSEDECSQNMGYWRKVYKWHETLKENWKNKRMTKYKLKQVESPVFCFDTNGELVATGHEDASIVIWSIKTIPYMMAEFKALLHERPILSLRIEDSFVIAVQKKLLQIYHRVDKLYKLTDLKSFELGDVSIDQMERFTIQKTNYSAYYEECLRAYDRMDSGALIYNFCNSMLYASTQNSKILRMWTLPGSEVTSQVETNSVIHQILIDKGDVHLVTKGETTNLIRYHPGIETQDMELCLPGFKRLMLGEELLAAVPSPGDVTLKRIWVYKKGNYSKPIGTRTILGFFNVCLYSKYVVLSEETHITVWEPLHNIVVSHFTTGCIVSHLRPSFSSYLLVFAGASLHLWDWKSKKHIYCIYNGLKWVGNYSNLLWANASTILSGGIEQQLEMLFFM